MSFYVSMTDRFMSKWGHAEGKTSKYIIICDTLDQANTIVKNAQKRTDMDNKTIKIHKDVCPQFNTTNYHSSFVHISQLGDVWTREETSNE